MSLPWMPLDVAAYRKDTAHLAAAEHGAYLLLIMHYWATGAVPDDDRQLARIAAMTPAEWKRARAVVQAFFYDGWRHKRIDKELARAADISSKRSAAAKLKHSNSSANADANAEQKHTHAGARPGALPPPPPSPSVPDGTGADAPPDPKTELFTRARAVLGAKAGGSLTAKLLHSIGPEDDPRTIAKARARIEEASTKAKPAEWLGRVMSPRNGQLALTAEGEPYPEGII
jgi:uncharacterized protein YdaU (DUF1376 family)